ncbi:MAG: glycoside hydrolase family 16 protein [Verrucomicrobia bacterium]|nr:glycoside hydrolase family 16 protein [Verrucomicrobiota bacterium]
MNTLKNSLRLFCFLAFTSLGFGQNTVGWTLVWADEFTQADGSSPNSTKWAYDIGTSSGGWGNNELEYYTSRTNNVRIENGQLVIEARQENYLGSSYTSARLKTQGKVSWAYGRIEARIKVPRGQGIWPAFWMLGTNITSVGWPTCGEIDVMENIGKEPALVHGTVHGPGYSGGSGIGASYSLPGTGAFADDFHIFAVEWTTNRIKWFVDGLQYFSVNPASLPGGASWVYTQPQFVLLNLAVGGNWPGFPDGTTTFPQRMLVDYVRVYAPTNLPACGTNLLSNPGLESGGLANWSAYGAGFNTLLENISHVPVHDGTNVFKVFGQFNGIANISGIFQDVPAVAAQSFAANGWVITPTEDSIAGANTAWIEVTFRDASTNTLALFRSTAVSTNSAVGVWLNLAITNQLNPTTFVAIGSVTNLVAPAGTAFARFQVTFRQPQSAAGAALFDDLKFSLAGSEDIPVPASIRKAGASLNLFFPTYLGLAYQVRFKDDLSDPNWQTLANLTGNGTEQITSDVSGTARRFFQVTRICN